jgi:hypothetical protein
MKTTPPPKVAFHPAIFILLLTLLCSCSPSVEDSIEGDWDYESYMNEYDRASSVTIEAKITGSRTFRKDGTYTSESIIFTTFSNSTTGIKIPFNLKSNEEGTWNVLEEPRAIVSTVTGGDFTAADDATAMLLTQLPPQSTEALRPMIGNTKIADILKLNESDMITTLRSAPDNPTKYTRR